VKKKKTNQTSTSPPYQNTKPSKSHLPAQIPRTSFLKGIRRRIGLAPVRDGEAVPVREPVPGAVPLPEGVVLGLEAVAVEAELDDGVF